MNSIQDIYIVQYKMLITLAHHRQSITNNKIK